MEKNNNYVGLELTSRAIKLLVGFYLNDQVYVLDMIEHECKGLRNGLIVDQELVIRGIKNIIKEAQEHLNIEIKDICLALPPFKMLCITDVGTTTTVDGNDIISHVDTLNILTLMKKRPLSDEDLKIVDIVPDTYIINENERLTTEPIGKSSSTLSLHASIYAMSNAVINQFVDLMNKIGLNVKYKVLSPYANALYLSSKDKLPESYLLIDIGHSLTTISQVHNKNAVISSKIIDFGGDDITTAISEKFELQYSEAENLKVLYGIDKSPNFKVNILNNITLDDLSSVIISTLKPAISKMKEVIGTLVGEKKDLPIIVIGGTSQLNNIHQLLAQELNMTVINFDVENIGARDKELITCLGLIKYCGVQPQVNEEETITASITRVDNKKISHDYKFDEEL